MGIQTSYFNKMHLKMAPAKWRPFCLRLNVLNSMVDIRHTQCPITNMLCIQSIIS